MQGVVKPKYQIWLKGKPRSFKKRKSSSRYIENIRDAARAVIPQPTHSKRLDIDIWFNAQGISRPDVDNIIKPILDAFKGIVYFDDNQVRSVRVVALSSGDAYKLRGSYKTLKRLINLDTKEFLINIYNDLKISGVLK